MKKIQIKVDADLCIGAAACVVVDPSTFVMNNENKAHVLDHGQDDQVYQRMLEVTDEELDRILLAAESCPVLAVTIFDENGKQLFPKS
ncbi:MAG: ferredoxin [Candidatus Uhrbacteria bacterium]